MEAGNRCFDMRVPEEINRIIVDHTSDINPNLQLDSSRLFLLREGLLPDMIVKTGSPMFEVINHYKKKIVSSDILSKHDLQAGEYFLVSAHREENIESDLNFGKLVDILTVLQSSTILPNYRIYASAD